MRSSFASALALVVALSACDKTSGPASIALTTQTPTVTIGQGATAQFVVNLARTNYDQPVTVSVSGLPTGVTAQLLPATIPGTGNGTTVVLTAAATAAPSTATLTVKATGDGVTEGSVTVDMTVTVTGNYTLGVLSSSMSVAQGGGGTNTVQINRTGGYGDNVTLSVAGAPSGLTATFSPSPTTASAATLTFSAAAGTPTGTYTVSVTGTAAGVANKTADITVNVIAPPATVSVTLPFCSNGIPTWLAFQNEGFNWQRVNPTGATFTFAAGPRVGVAVAYTGTGFTELDIMYLTRAELASFDDRNCSGPKTLSGSVAGLSTGQAALVSMGAASAQPSSFQTSFTINGVPTRTVDLVATRGTISGEFFTPDKIIVRRNLSLTSGSTIPVLDFSTEGAAPASTTITVTGFGTGEQIALQNTLWTGTNTYGVIHVPAPSSSSFTMLAAPPSLLTAGDVQELYIDADATTPNASSISERRYLEYYATPANRTAALGPQLNTATFSTLAGASYSRARMQLVSQPEYPDLGFGIIVNLTQTSEADLVLITSAGYLGATPSTWDVVVPDFTGVSGFTSAWAPATGQLIYAAGARGRPTLILGGLPVDGDIVRTAFRGSCVSICGSPPPSASIAGKSRSMSPFAQYFARQYFKR